MTRDSTSHPVNDRGVESVTPARGATTLSGTAYRDLRSRIVTLELAPGTAFTEAEASAWLMMGKAPVRAALGQLRRDGLVDAAARAGYTVAPMTVRDARDLFGLRVLLEGEASALAAARGGDLDGLRALDAMCRVTYDPHDCDSVHVFLCANADFHLAIAELGGNVWVTDQLARTLDHLQRYMHLGLRLAQRAESIEEEHRDLLAAIAAGDPARARRLAELHAGESRHMVLEGLLSSDAVLNANIGHGLVTTR